MTAGVCANVGCSNSISKKWILCRPCAVADLRDRHPYIEPCPSYVRDRYFPIVMLCSECGFDSAEHPGRGRVALTKVQVKL